MKLQKIKLYDSLSQKEMGKLVGGVNEAIRGTPEGAGVFSGERLCWSSDTEYGYMEKRPGGIWEFVRIETRYAFCDCGDSASNGNTIPGNTSTGIDDGGTMF